jgi:hypothetical protein
MKYFTTLLVVVLVISSPAASAQKRGLAYGHNSPEDLAVMSPEISWWYNWSETPEGTVAIVYENYGFDFVPMTWNGNFSETKLRGFLANHPETKYLLAFNEPNFLAQANMTPTAAVAQWPRLEAIADDYNLKIVGPAVNYCGECVTENGVTYTDPFKYLDDFFAACPECRVDYIAAHCYMNTISALKWYISQYYKYHKSIWLTEFAGWESNGNIKNVNDQINYMISAVDFLESDTNIFRYSWFVGRGSGIATYPYIDILGENGQLTALGEVYKQMPVHDTNNVIAIPGTIQAENYNTMSGILIEKTLDVSGFANVGYIEAGDWLEYKIDVSESAGYDIRFRIASTKAASLKILIDGNTLLTQNFTYTGGWQNWKTFINKINLTAGIHTLRLQALTDGFNINWLHIGDGAEAVKEITEIDKNLTIFPNPGNGNFTIQTTEDIAELRVQNILGKVLAKLPYSASVDLSYLSPGLYVLSALDKEGKVIETKMVSLIR